MPKNDLDVGLRYEVRSQLVGRVKSEPAGFPAGSHTERHMEQDFGCHRSFRQESSNSEEKRRDQATPAAKFAAAYTERDTEKDIARIQKCRKELLDDVEKRQTHAQGPPPAKSFTYQDYANRQAGLNNRTSHAETRTKFSNKIPANPYETQAPPFQFPAAERDIKKDINRGHKSRKEFWEDAEKRRRQGQASPASKSPAAEYADSDIENDLTRIQKFRQEFLEDVQKRHGIAAAPSAAKSSTYNVHTERQTGLNDKACHDDSRTKFLKSVSVNPYGAQVSTTQVSTERDIEKDVTSHHRLRKEYMNDLEIPSGQGKDPPTAKSSSGKVYADCYDRECRDYCRTKFSNRVSVDPYEVQVSPAQTSTNRCHEKTVRSKEKMPDCGVKCRPQHRRQSGGDADRLLNERPYTACIEGDSCSRTACYLSPRQGQGKSGKSSDKSTPKGKQDSDSTNMALCMTTDDEDRTSSSIAPSNYSVREIRKLTTSQCRLHDTITTSLKNLGHGDEEVTGKLNPENLTRTYCLNKTPPSLKMPPRSDAKLVSKVQKMFDKSNSCTISKMEAGFPRAKPPRHDNPQNPLTKAGTLLTKDKAGDNFGIGIDDVVHAKVISPVVRKIHKMYFRSMRSELSVMEELDSLPSKVSQLVKSLEGR